MLSSGWCNDFNLNSIDITTFSGNKSQVHAFSLQRHQIPFNDSDAPRIKTARWQTRGNFGNDLPFIVNREVNQYVTTKNNVELTK